MKEILLTEQEMVIIPWLYSCKAVLISQINKTGIPDQIRQRKKGKDPVLYHVLLYLGRRGLTITNEFGKIC